MTTKQPPIDGSDRGQQNPSVRPGTDVPPLTWLRLLRDDSAFGRELGVLAMLASRVSGKTGEGFASLEQLARDTGSSISTVQRALTAAKKAGYLHDVRRGGIRGNGRADATTYQLRDPGEKQ